MGETLTHFELTLPLLDEHEAAWLGRMRDLDGGDSYLLTLSEGPDGLSAFFHSEGYGDPLALAETLRTFLHNFRPTGVIGLTWATLGPDGHGGGAIAVSTRSTRRQNLARWLRVAEDDLALVHRREHLERTGHDTFEEWASCNGYVQHPESGDWYLEGGSGGYDPPTADPRPALDAEVAAAAREGATT